MQQAAALGHRDAGNRVRHRLGAQRRALERIERDVDPLAGAAADLFADIEHRRLVALALADHHQPVHVENAVERRAHGIDRRLVGLLLVAAPAPLRRRDRRRLGDPRDLDGEVFCSACGLSSDRVPGDVAHSRSMRIMRGFAAA